MPYGWFSDYSPPAARRTVVGHPKRDRSKVKASRRANRARRR